MGYLARKSGLGLEMMQEGLGIQCDPPLLDRQYLDFVIENFDLKPAVNHEINDLGQHFVGVSILIADAADTDGRQLPAVVVAHFRHGDIELVSDTTDYRFQHLPFAFKGHIFRQAEVYLAHAHIHGCTRSGEMNKSGLDPA